MSGIHLTRFFIGIDPVRFLVWGATALIAGAVLGFSYRPILDRLIPQKVSATTIAPALAAPTNSVLSWQTKNVSLSVYEGMEAAQSVNIVVTGKLTQNPTVKVSAGLASIVTVDIAHPTDMKNNIATVSLTADMPAAANDTYAGTVQLVYNGVSTGAPLAVSIHTLRANCQTIPTTPDEPSPARIGSWLGSPVVEDTIEVSMATPGPQADHQLTSIACKYHALIVGAVSDVGLYELRVPGKTIDTLLPIITQVKSEPGVQGAAVDMLAQLDSAGAQGPQ